MIREHKKHVQLVLAKLQEAGLYLKLSKCVFEMQRINFVRFNVMLEGV
jgi:recombinational DNA repair protein (RecF pathway)